MKCKNILANNDAVSPVIGFILIMSIVTVSIGIIYTTGIPMLDSARLDTHMKNIQGGFSVIHDDIQEVARGPVTGAGTARTSRIDMAGGGLFVEPNSSSMTVTYTEGTLTTTKNLLPGIIYYKFLDRSVVYEYGAVFSKYESSSVMEIEPMIYAVNLGSNRMSLMIHIINLTGKNSSIGGTGVGKIRSSVTNEGPIRLYEGEVKAVSITMTSQNYDAWARYFSNSISSAGLNINNANQYAVTYPANGVVKIDIKGPGGSAVTDIRLLVFETKIQSTAE